jgi:predicted metal-dependent HD superfamily phosphohydrolase
MLIDADLHILQAPIDEYMAYAKAIRYEYGYISDDDYREGRTKFLEGFLSRPNIYYHLRHLDEYARSNMRHEIDILADLQKSDAILKAD